MSFDDAVYVVYSGLGAWLLVELIRFFRRS